MKKKIILSIIVGSLVAVSIFIGCKKDQCVQKELAPTIQTSSQILVNTTQYKKMIPFQVIMEGNVALIGFIETQTPFTLDLSNKANAPYLKTIQDAIKSDLAMKVFVKENTTEIVSVNSLSQREVYEYKKLLIGSGETDK